MACDRCADLCESFFISSPAQLKNALQVVADNRADDTIRIVSGAVPADGAFSDGIECMFACTRCGHAFALWVGPDGKGGGGWREEPGQTAQAAREAAGEAARVAGFPPPGAVRANSRAELRRRLGEAGLGARADALLALARPCVQLEPAPCAPDALAHGASRVGGPLCVSSGFDWPEHDAAPLDFLCQIDLEEVPGDALPALPRSGRLAFFYAVAENPWGDARAHATAARVHYESATALTEIASAHSARCHALRLVHGLNLPGASDPALAALAGGPLDDAERGRYFDVVQGIVADHHLMGHADPLQDLDMREDCAAHARVGGRRTQPSDWQLLLQLGGDTHPLGLPWDGSGRLYFWIHTRDLAAARFDRCWATFQAT